MKLHRLSLAAALLAGALLTSGCEKYLDIKPVSAKPDVNSYNTTAKVDATLSSAYFRLQNGDMYGGQIQVLNELYGDNIDFDGFTGTTGDAAFINRQFSIFFNPGAGLWTAAYEAIFRANLAIEAVDQNKFDAPQADKDRVKGEALFIRAVSHFELVRLFAKPYSNNPTADPGVPLRLRVLSSNEAANDRVGRNRVAEVYTQVIADLQQAATLLPAANADRPTAWAAKAYLARVYFEQLDNPNADRLATDVIANGGFTLGTPPESVTAPFLQSGVGARAPSVVFQLTNAQGADGAGGLRGAFYDFTPSNINRALASTGPNNILDALRLRGGVRYDSLVVVNDPSDPATPVPRPYSRKFRGPNPLGNEAVNVPILRLQELLLTRAEARALAGGSDAAVRADLNAVRTAAGRPADNTSTGAALLAAVRDERRIELVLEGDRFQQLRRLRLPSRGIAFNSGRLLPIPLGEVSGNANIEQNGD